MAWEWILVGFIWLGIRKRIRLRDLIGGRWANAGRFLPRRGVRRSVLGRRDDCARHRRQADAPRSGRQDRKPCASSSDFSLPGRIWSWRCGSASARLPASAKRSFFADICSGSSPRWADSMLLGVLLSAVVFGASHGYEGVARMILIAIYRIDVWVTRVVAKEPARRNDGACVARRAERRSFADAEIATCSDAASQAHHRSEFDELRIAT